MPWCPLLLRLIGVACGSKSNLSDLGEEGRSALVPTDWQEAKYRARDRWARNFTIVSHSGVGSQVPGRSHAC